MSVQELIDALLEVKDKSVPVQMPMHYTENQYEEVSSISDEGSEVVLY